MTNGRTYLRATFNAFCDIPQGTSEYSRSVDRQLGRLDMSQAAFLFPNDTPPRHSYHSRRVIARSGSGSRQTTSREPLARATLGSFATRSLNGRRVGVRATSNERTYRRSGVESVVDELRKNRGSKLKRPAEGKSCSVSESRKNSYGEEEKKPCLIDLNAQIVKKYSTTVIANYHHPFPSCQGDFQPYLPFTKSQVEGTKETHFWTKIGRINQRGKRKCDKCRKRKAYWSSSWCEPCIWRFVKE